jgi:methyl-accepting chemotaxis protein
MKTAKKVGVFGADIDQKYIQSLVEQLTHTANGRYSFIIDGDGVVVAHPDHSYFENLSNFKTLTRTVVIRDENGHAVLNPDGSVVTIEEELVISDSLKAVMDSIKREESGLPAIPKEDRIYYADAEQGYCYGSDLASG